MIGPLLDVCDLRAGYGGSAVVRDLSFSVDPGEIREIRELIGRLSAHGATVLLSSHHLSEVEQVCSHVIVMNPNYMDEIRATVRGIDATVAVHGDRGE